MLLKLKDTNLRGLHRGLGGLVGSIGGVPLLLLSLSQNVEISPILTEALSMLLLNSSFTLSVAERIWLQNAWGFKM